MSFTTSLGWRLLITSGYCEVVPGATGMIRNGLGLFASAHLPTGGSRRPPGASRRLVPDSGVGFCSGLCRARLNRRQVWPDRRAQDALIIVLVL